MEVILKNNTASKRKVVLFTEEDSCFKGFYDPMANPHNPSCDFINIWTDVNVQIHVDDLGDNIQRRELLKKIHEETPSYNSFEYSTDQPHFTPFYYYTTDANGVKVFKQIIPLLYKDKTKSVNIITIKEKVMISQFSGFLFILNQFEKIKLTF